MINETQNNLISKTISATKTTETKQPQKNVQTAVIQEIKPDTFEKKTVANSSKISSKDILNGIISFGLCIGLFFLPDMIFAYKNRKQSKFINKIKGLKPAFKNLMTSQEQKQLKNGNIKITLEGIKDKFKYNEIIILDQNGKIKQRILTRKEKMPNGKYLLRNMKSYKGSDLHNNSKVARNESKYLVKEYKRSKVENNQYKIKINEPNKGPKEYHCYCTKNGEPILRVQTFDDRKENTMFLYDRNFCVGTDKQVAPQDSNKPTYNILNIPKKNIKDKVYTFKNYGEQYDSKLIEKFMNNF